MSFIDFVSSFTELYDRQMAPISKAHDLTSMELSILLFLANNPNYDTAKDIVSKRNLTKSHVSISLRELEERGFVKKERRNGNNKTLHIVLLPASHKAVYEGQKAQAEFFSTIMSDFSKKDTEIFLSYIARINENITTSLDALKKEVKSK